MDLYESFDNCQRFLPDSDCKNHCRSVRDGKCPKEIARAAEVLKIKLVHLRDKAKL